MSIEKREIRSSEQSNHFRTHLATLVDPFLTVTDTNNSDHVGIEIATILDCNEEYMLKKLRENNISTLSYSTMIEKVKKALRERKISKDAPWFKQLEDKMIGLELFRASIGKEMDLKKGKKDLRDLLDHAGEGLKKAKEIWDSSNSGKK